MGTNLVGLLLPDLATVTSALEVLGCSPWVLFLEMFLSDSLFLGGGIAGRGGSSGMSGSSLRLIPNTSKGSGDPKPNFIRIINFVCFQRLCSFSKWMRTFSCTCIPHTHAKNGCAVFLNIPAVFCGRCIVLHGGCAILRKTCIICDVQEFFYQRLLF